MNKYGVVILVALVASLAGGCGGARGWLIKPVSIDESLKETVLEDPGLFVFDKIVIVDVDGTLLNQRDSGLFGMEDNPVSLFIEKLNKAAGDDNVRAVVLRINSPGGSVTATDIMYRRLLQFGSDGIPVVALIEDVGASGGYYLACGAKTILAHPTSVTGSIGVIVQTISVAGIMDKLGIEAKAVTSGPRKDIASPLKPLDEKDLAIIQGMVEAYYKRFLLVVGANRLTMEADKIKELADGRVYTGEQAKEHGLVDGLGYMDTAIDAARELADVKKAKVVIYHRPLGYRAHAYSAAQMPTPQVNLINISMPQLADLARPQFLYMWTGKTYGR